MKEKVEEREREMALVVLEEIFENNNDVEIGERAKIWILKKIEMYLYKQYLWQKRKKKSIEEYIKYAQEKATTRAILKKKEWLLQDLQRTKKSLLKRAKQGKVIVRAGTKDSPTRQEAALYISDLKFSNLFDEILNGEPIWNAIAPAANIEIQNSLFK